MRCQAGRMRSHTSIACRSKREKAFSSSARVFRCWRAPPSPLHFERRSSPFAKSALAAKANFCRLRIIFSALLCPRTRAHLSLFLYQPPATPRDYLLLTAPLPSPPTEISCRVLACSIWVISTTSTRGRTWHWSAPSRRLCGRSASSGIRI